VGAVVGAVVRVGVVGVVGVVGWAGVGMRSPYGSAASI